jgi:hypothetical protein
MSCDICIYRKHGVALLHGYWEIFPNQTRSLSLIGLYLFRKNWTIQNPKLKHQVFAASTLDSNLICFVSLMFFLPFHASNTLKLHISSCYLLL